jgi:hypothetical protein
MRASSRIGVILVARLSPSVAARGGRESGHFRAREAKSCLTQRSGAVRSERLSRASPAGAEGAPPCCRTMRMICLAVLMMFQPWDVCGIDSPSHAQMGPPERFIVLLKMVIHGRAVGSAPPHGTVRFSPEQSTVMPSRCHGGRRRGCMMAERVQHVGLMPFRARPGRVQ